MIVFCGLFWLMQMTFGELLGVWWGSLSVAVMMCSTKVLLYDITYLFMCMHTRVHMCKNTL